MLHDQKDWTYRLDILIEDNWYSSGFIKEAYPDQSCSYFIKKKEIEFWITSSRCEYSIGFNNIDNECTWHTHMSLYDANTINEQLSELNNQIDKIINNKVKIVLSLNTGIGILDNNGENHQNNDMSLIYKYWTELD